MDAPTSEVELEMLFHAMAGRLERSDIVIEFLTIMRSAPIPAIVGRRGSDRGLGPKYGGVFARLEQPRARQSCGRSRLVAHAAVSHAVDRR